MRAFQPKRQSYYLGRQTPPYRAERQTMYLR